LRLDNWYFGNSLFSVSQFAISDFRGLTCCGIHEIVDDCSILFVM
jgi:hypothetical protein